MKITKEQEEYIINNFSSMQTWMIEENIKVNKDTIYNIAEKYKIKKAKDYKVVRKEGTLTVEQCNFIQNNYSTMSNKEMESKLNITHNQLRSFSSRRGLTKKSKEYRDSSHYTKEQVDYIKNNYENKMNRDLIKETGLSDSQILYLANQLGLKKSENLKKTNNSILTFEQKKFIRENFSTMKTNDICRKLKLEYNQIHSYSNNLKLKKEAYYSESYNGYWIECLEIHNNGYDVWEHIGVEVEPKVEFDCLYKSKYGKYYVNQNYFEKIDNEWKAYWLGFLYADGCNMIKRNSKKNKMEYTTKLTLASIDKKHVEKLRDSVQGDAPISDKEVKLGDKIFYSSSYSMCNKKICEDLQSLGCVPNKSIILKFPTEDQVPKEFIRDFIRGYFDGDGCIHINLEKQNIQFNIMGTLEFIEEIQKIFTKKLDIRETKIQKKNDNKAYSLQYGSIMSIQKIYRYLYKDCNIYLDRKLEKFNTLLWLD